MQVGHQKRIFNLFLSGTAGMFAVAVLTTFDLTGQTVQRQRLLTHDRDLQTTIQGPYMPRFEGGMLVGYLKNHGSGPILYAIDREGRKDETIFTIPEAALINLYDIAASATGEIILVGSCVTADSRGSGFVARIGADRKSQTVTRTGGYNPSVVTVTANDEVWTIGNLKDDADRDVALHVLRRFDRTGRLLGSTTLHVRGWQTAVTSYLRSSRDRVGWLTAAGQYLEFSLDGSEIARFDGPQVADWQDINGVAMSADGEVVVGRSVNRVRDYLILHRDKRAWSAVPLPDKAPASARALGFDGTMLVTSNGPGRLGWFRTD